LDRRFSERIRPRFRAALEMAIDGEWRSSRTKFDLAMLNPRYMFMKNAVNDNLKMLQFPVSPVSQTSRHINCSGSEVH